MNDFDVLVLGGGGAGLAAAVGAARCGARTLLVERGGSLGGMASAALVHSICGLYRLPVSEAGALSAAAFANPGFATEFALRLMAFGSAGRPGGAGAGSGVGLGAVRMGRVDVLLQHPTDFARAADAVVLETPNLELRLHSELIALGNGFRKARVWSRGREETLAVRAVVDASGDAVAASLGGAPCEQESSGQLQRPAFIFALHGVDPKALEDDGRLRIARRVATAVQSGRLPAGALGASVRSSGRGGEAFITIDLEAPGYDPLDALCLTSLEIQGRALAGQLAEFLRLSVPGFESSFIGAFPSRVGVRESRRMVGQYRLDGADLERGTRFADEVALATWPMELRETHRGPRLRYPVDGQPCGIPLRALRGRDHENLFAAGRCMSCSHEAQASIRVIGTCLATGEAAGIGAALFTLQGSVDAAAVRAMQESQAAAAQAAAAHVEAQAGSGAGGEISGGRAR